MRAEPENLIYLMFDNRRQYQIPVYQRNYDWKKGNCIELFNDVLHAYDKEKTHFLGTVVQVQKDDEHGIKRYIIIDGQQRMTSIYLLLKALYDNASDEVTKNELFGLLYNYSSDRQYDKDEKSKLKLKPIKSDNEQFVLLMNDKLDEMDRASNIYINYNCFCELIKKAIATDYTIRSIIKGLRYLQIVMISLKEPDDEPQVIFERINSTGEDLTLADLIRNYILMTDVNMEYLFEEYWLPMELSIGKEMLNDYFINYLVFKLPDVLDSKNAYSQFKKFADKIDHETILKDLKYYSKFYKAFTKSSSDYSKEINNMLNGYRILKQTTIYPFLFNVFKDFEDNIINEETLLNVLGLFLNYTLRRAITGVPTNSLRGLYKTLYRRIFVSDDVKSNYYESICNFMASITTKDMMPNDTTFKDKLMSENLYKNKNVCKFILSVIENGFSSIKERVNIDEQITIEHIMPQNKDSLDWQNEIGPNFPFVYDRYLHTLGNLTLTGYNSELSDDKFLLKVKLIKEKSKFNKLNSDVIDKTRWTETAITTRADRLSTILVNEFKLPEAFKKTPSIDKENSKHTVFDGADLTNTKPVYFIFMGEKKEVSNYTELLLKVCDLFYILDPNKFSEMAKNEFKFNNGIKPCLSYNSEALRTPKEVGDTGIYVESNHSSNTMISFIKIMLDEFGVSYDDFIFYVISTKE